jgi:predicted branched-subunit amino acid permease
MPSPRSEFFSGIKAQLPILIGVIPFGMIYGVLALEAGLSIGVAQSMSFIIFAGSSQIVATQLFGSSVHGLVIILTLSVINLRHMLYSASIAPYMKSLRPLWKWSLAYLLTDEAYALTITRYQEGEQPTENRKDNRHWFFLLTDEAYALTITRDQEGEQPTENRKDNRHWFFLGTGLALWLTWQLSTAAGIFLGVIIPVHWPLDFTIALTFIALIIPMVKDRPGLIAALAADILALLTLNIPLRLGLVIAALGGIIAGVLAESRS